MSELTGNDLLTGLDNFIGDYWQSMTTSAGAADGTTIVDTLLRRNGKDVMEEGYIRVVSAGANQNQVRRISSFTGATPTVSPAFPAQVASGTVYEYHRYDPARKFNALDRARFLAYPQVAVVVMDDTITGDGIEKKFQVPDAIRKGPVQAYEEKWLTPFFGWNPLLNPAGDTLTGWTAATLTATIRNRIDQDWIIPKHAAQQCTLLSGIGTYRQAVASFTNVTAAIAAGREVTFGWWVYCLAANSVCLEIVDDGDTAQSVFHDGRGWQYLQVTKRVAQNNATLLTVGYRATAANTHAYVQEAMLRFGGRIGIPYPAYIPQRGLWRNGDVALVELTRAPAKGYQLRLVGRRPLSPLGTNIDVQATNTMEVDEAMAELLYAKAARLLFVDAGMAAGNIDTEIPKIKEVEDRFAQMAPDWESNIPFSEAVDGWWSLR